jgi:hypothetical protein
MLEIGKSGSVRGVKFFYKAEYCDTLQSKEGRNVEYKVCLNKRASHLLDKFSNKNTGCLQRSPLTMSIDQHYDIDRYRFFLVLQRICLE